jgi:predicted HicB family RNase H-like nuclease
VSPRGGKRPGAGRPKQAGARVTLAVRVDPITRLRLEREAEQQGTSMGELIDHAIAQLWGGGEL